MSEENRPIPEDGIVPPPEPKAQPTELESPPPITDDPSPVQSATERLEQNQAPAPEPAEVQDAYQVDLDGRVETVTKKEYDYLAKLGAQSLIAAQYQQQQDSLSTPEQPEYPQPDNAYEHQAPDDSGQLKERLSNLEENLYRQQVASKQERIKQDVEARIAQSPVFQAAFQLEDGDKLQREVRKEIYNRAVQEQIPALESLDAVERKWKELLGKDRSSKLLKKLRESHQAVADTGGGYTSAGEPMDANAWTTGALLKSVSERLTNTDS